LEALEDFDMPPTAAATALDPVLAGEDACHEIRLKSGQMVRVVAVNGQITMTPDLPLSALRGFVRGISTDGVRDKKERL